MAAEFSALIKAAIERMRARHDQSMEDLAARVGVSSQALYKAMSRKGGAAIGYDTAMRIADEADLSDAERFELETAWLFSRAAGGSLGRIFKVALKMLQSEVSPEKMKRGVREMLREYRGEKS